VFPAEFAESSFDDELPASIQRAIERMLLQQEPFPLIVLNRGYDVLRANRAAQRVFTRFLAEIPATPRLNLYRLLFDPRAIRGFVVEWESVARNMLARLHRESLARPSDTDLASLAGSLFEYHGVPRTFRHPDLSVPSEPTICIRLRREDLDLAFFTTITSFNAPQNMTLEELRVES
jgi:hypothetical protein